MSTINVDPEEIKKFAAMANAWWDPKGEFAPLHQLNPVRLAFIREEIGIHFDLELKGRAPLTGLNILDVGCGGGLVCEPLARLGARVTGIDAARESIAAASAHAAENGLDIVYENATAEHLAAQGRQFDVVLALEIIEHVMDASSFVRTVASLARPGGLLILSTINRTPEAYALAIVGAERILRWVPEGTHEFRKFVTPKEIECAAPHLAFQGPVALTYDPIRRDWRIGGSATINYFMIAAIPDHPKA
jgi:2-polyprenyl-6-hydroxyphenyl methylase/3-demethylubiquinone-9 3-methyltransferase